MNASNADSHIHILGTASLSDSATFDLGGQLIIQNDAADDSEGGFTVDGDFTVTVDGAELAAHILNGRLDVTNTFSLMDSSGNDRISIQGTLDADQVTLSLQFLAHRHR